MIKCFCSNKKKKDEKNENMNEVTRRNVKLLWIIEINLVREWQIINFFSSWEIKLTGDFHRIYIWQMGYNSNL